MKIEIDMKLLEKISDYYEFPLTVFFLNKDYKFSAKTRKKHWIKFVKEYRKKFVDLCDEFTENL